VSLGVVYGLVLASTRPRRLRITSLIPLIWFTLALMRVRHAPLFGITAVLALAEILPDSPLARWLARPGRELFRFPASPRGAEDRLPGRPMALPLTVVATTILLQWVGARMPILGRGWAQLDPTTWPVELLPELRRCERERSHGGRIFNDYQFGGFL